MNYIIKRLKEGWSPELISGRLKVERRTRQVRISKCLNKTALETRNAIIDKLKDEDAEYLRTITFDRGTEGALHAEIAKELGVEIFFCHAYCSWESG